MPQYPDGQSAESESARADRLVAAMAPRLYRYALVRLGRVDLAEDAVAETLCRLIEKGPPLEGDPAHATGWCVRCMVNVCRELARRPREVTQADRSAAESPAYRFADWHDGRNEESRMLIDAMSRISERQQEAVTLRVLMGLPVQAAAEAMQCAEGTVKALTHQGIAALRRIIEQETARREARSETPNA